MHNFDEIGRFCHCRTKKIKYGRKTANINTKNIRNVITVKAHCSMTHIKQQKKTFGFF